MKINETKYIWQVNSWKRPFPLIPLIQRKHFFASRPVEIQCVAVINDFIKQQHNFLFTSYKGKRRIWYEIQKGKTKSKNLFCLCKYFSMEIDFLVLVVSLFFEFFAWFLLFYACFTGSKLRKKESLF